jgi:hypothetical protein
VNARSEDGSEYLSIDPLTQQPKPFDFEAVAEVISRVPGLCTLQRLPAGEKLEYRNPVETHFQLWPFPLLESVDAPLIPYLQRVSKDKPGKVSCFSFKHSLQWFRKLAAADIDEAFKAASKELGVTEDSGYDLVIGKDFLIMAPITAPADKRMWEKMPPVPSIGLVGLIIVPEVKAEFPETAGVLSGDFVYKPDVKTITSERILSTVHEDPLAILAQWR